MSILKNPEYSFPPEVWVNIFSFIQDPDLIFDLEDVCSFFRVELNNRILPGNLTNRGLIRKFRNRRVTITNLHKVNLEVKPLEFNIGLIGEEGVGKTSLYTAYAQKSPIMIDLMYGSGDKPVVTKAKYEGHDVIFKLVDLERFSGQFEPPKLDFSTSHGVMLCYDVTKMASLLSLVKYWLPYIAEKSPSNTIFFLVAMKTETPEHERKVSKYTGESIARLLRMQHWEVSSVGYTNVTQLFASMHSAIVHEYYTPDQLAPDGSKSQHHHHNHGDKNKCSIM